MTRNLVVFGEDWGRHPSSTQHLISRLAISRDVIWLNSIGLRRPRLNRSDMGRVKSKLAGMIKRPVEDAIPDHPVPPRMSILSPRAVSWPGSQTADVLNRKLLSGQILAEMGRRNFDSPIVWTSLPTALPVLYGLPKGPVVYYCGDDFGALVGVDHEPVLAMEQKLARRADIIFAASSALAERFPAAKTVLIPHGVDLELFQTPQPRPADLPAHDRIAGVYGSISEWIDVDAIAQTARLMPEWLFVLIGPVRTNVDALSGISNIRLLGEKPHDALPGYVQHWQVSLLPFRDTPQIRACNPLKLREYLATGNPVVSPMFRALEPYAAVIQPVEYGGNYAAAILAAASDTASNGRRKLAVAKESWDQRAAEISAILETL